METTTKERYPRTRKALDQVMKIVQRELEDGRLKVDLLSDLLGLKEKLEDGRRTGQE